MARYALLIESNPNDYVEKAVSAFKESIRINEKFPWVYNDIGLAINTIGAFNHENGKNPVVELRNAIAFFQKAIEIDQMYQSAYTGALRSYRLIIAHKISVGVDPAADIAESDLLAERLLKMNRNNKAFYRNRVAQRLEFAGYLIKVGNNPESVLQLVMRDISAMRSIDNYDVMINPYEAHVYQFFAMHNARNGLSPMFFTEKGLAAAQKCLDMVPDSSNCIATYGALRIIEWLWLEKNGKRIDDKLSQYLKNLLSLSESIREDPDVGCVIAEVACLLAERVAGKVKNAALEIGSREISAVLLRASHLSLAYVLRGRLWSLTAAERRNRNDKRLGFANARSSFVRAFELDPLLRRQYGAQLAEAERRLGIASTELND